MSDTAVPPAGWYPDPDRPGATRWWDGSTWAPHPGEPAQPPLPAGTGNTWSIYLQAVTPFVLVAANWLSGYPQALATLIARQHTALDQLRSAPTGDPATAVAPLAGLQIIGPALLVQQAVGLLLLAAVVLLAVRDWSTLKRRGVIRPFHWAWSFLMPTYPIGRAVVLHRRTERGLAPLWVYVACFIVASVLNVLVLVPVFAAVTL